MKTFQRTTSSAGRRAMRVSCSTQNTTSSRSPAATGGVRCQSVRSSETSDGPSRGGRASGAGRHVESVSLQMSLLVSCAAGALYWAQYDCFPSSSG